MKNRYLGVQAGALVCCVGLAHGVSEETPTVLEPTAGRVYEAAHIYYNVATGERVVTVLGDSQTAGADTGNSTPIWSIGGGSGCADFGFTTSFFFGVDDPDPADTLSTNVTLVDFGDIALDTVVDCITVNWVVAHPDTDSDFDSVGDGVEDLGGNWIVWDADNGRAINQSTRIPLVDFTFTDLPGNIFGAGSLTGYTLDVDLLATFTGTDLSFEIGDSDGDCQTAAFCNSSVFDSATGTFVPVAQADNDFDGLPDSDLDGDGLFDWSWSVRFLQPGVEGDLDGDGMIGDPAPTASDTIGISFGVPEGTAIDNGDGTWTYDIDEDAPAAPTGAEDAFAIYAPPDANGDINHAGLFWFGGFSCTPDPDTGLITPLAMFAVTIYGPGGIACCPGDFDCDGEVNFFDVSAFLSAFNAGDPSADVNNDNDVNFFDVSLFLADFNAGCP